MKGRDLLRLLEMADESDVDDLANALLARDGEGCTPLLWAAKENHTAIATMLLDLGEDVNQQQPLTGQLSQRLSALHVAAQKGNEEMVELLLSRGADRMLRDKHNNTALSLAEKKKHLEIIALLKGGGVFDA